MLSITRINTKQHSQPHIAKKEKNSPAKTAINPYDSIPLNAFKSNAITFEGSGEKVIVDYENLDGIDETVVTDDMFEYARGAFVNMYTNQGTVFEYEQEDLRPDLLIDNIQFALQNDLMKKMGFDKEKHTLMFFDTDDYKFDDTPTLSKVKKRVKKFKKENPDKEPILIFKNFHSLVNEEVDEPRKIFNSEFLKNHKYIGLAEELNDEAKEMYSFDYKKYSKLVNHVLVDALDDEDMRILLKKEAFIKRYISEGKELEITDEAIDVAQEMVHAKGLYNYNISEVLIFQKILAIKTMRGEDTKEINATDVDEAYEGFEFDEIDDDETYAGNEVTSSSGDKVKAPLTVHKNIKTNFKDVGGMFFVKEEIKHDFLDVVGNPDVDLKYIPAGILLNGPPGTGKTLLAKAIAGEAGLPFISMSGSGFNEQFVGVGAARARDLFKTARKEAKKHPKKMAIVFIDEIDAIARKRGSSHNEESDNTLNAILEEMDGIKNKDSLTEKVIVVAATNRKDILDDAAIRKGRFDLEYNIDDPSRSEKARKEIIKIHSKDLKFKDDNAKEKILENFAKTSQGLSGAEIAAVLKAAFRMSLRKDREFPYITQEDMNDAKLKVIAGVKTDEELAAFVANSTILHEAGHALNNHIMNEVFKNANPRYKPMHELDFITNEGRGDTAGTTFLMRSDNDAWTFEALISDLASSYGGLSVEKTLIGGNASGCSGDLEHSTKLINSAIRKYGLGPNTKHLSLNEEDYIMADMYKKPMKKDFELMRNLGLKISDNITKFAKEFLEDYANKFKENPKLRHELITAEKFKSMFNEWLKENGNQKEYDRLLKVTYRSIQRAKQPKVLGLVRVPKLSTRKS